MGGGPWRLRAGARTGPTATPAWSTRRGTGADPPEPARRTARLACSAVDNSRREPDAEALVHTLATLASACRSRAALRRERKEYRLNKAASQGYRRFEMFRCGREST